MRFNHFLDDSETKSLTFAVIGLELIEDLFDSIGINSFAGIFHPTFNVIPLSLGTD